MNFGSLVAIFWILNNFNIGHGRVIDIYAVKELPRQKQAENSTSNLCHVINSSPFFVNFLFCCNNKLYRKPEHNEQLFFRCCNGAGLYADFDHMECCGDALVDTTSELCINNIIIPIANYINQIIYGGNKGNQGLKTFVHPPSDLTTKAKSSDGNWNIENDLEVRDRMGLWHWDASLWLNCSGKMIFNPEGRKSKLLDCCGQTPYKRDKFYCVDGRLVEIDFNNGHWLPPAVAPQQLRPPFDPVLSPSQNSALLQCQGVWYSISFTLIFLTTDATNFTIQRYSCCGRDIYNTLDYQCMDDGSLERYDGRLIADPGYTLVMCSDFNALHWRPDLGHTPAITYLVDDSLADHQRPDACCGVQLYQSSKYSCTVNGLYPSNAFKSSFELLDTPNFPRCRLGKIIGTSSRYWHCCGNNEPYNILDSFCCGSTIVNK